MVALTGTDAAATPARAGRQLVRRILPAHASAIRVRSIVILSTWTEGDSLLRDYAHREWAGLLRDLYHRRWQRFFEYLEAELAGGGQPPDLFALESAWVEGTDPDGVAFPDGSVGDPVDVAAEVLAKYTGPVPTCGGQESPPDRRIRPGSPPS